VRAAHAPPSGALRFRRLERELFVVVVAALQAVHEQARSGVAASPADLAAVESDHEEAGGRFADRVERDRCLIVREVEALEKGLLCVTEIGYRLPR
jgi:hypothetical protein